MTPTIEQLKAHRSIRKFENRPIATDLLHELIQAGQAAASSSFLQAATIIRISDPAKRASLAAMANHQPYIESAAEFLVFCADMNRRRAVVTGMMPALIQALLNNSSSQQLMHHLLHKIL